MVIVPNVTTIDGMLNSQTRMPLSAPKTVPISVAIKIKMGIWKTRLHAIYHRDDHPRKSKIGRY